jgi:hypothetical protein
MELCQVSELLIRRFRWKRKIWIVILNLNQESSRSGFTELPSQQAKEIYKNATFKRGNVVTVG